MNDIADIVTMNRADYDDMKRRLAEYDALLERIERQEDAEDIAAYDRYRDEETIPFEMAERMLDGESRVTVWREYRGLTQRSLAQAAGLSQSMMNEIERGKRQPSLDKARAIAAALRVGLDDLWLES